MSLPHFFLREQVLADEPAPVFALQLESDDLKHAKVLRLSEGEHIAVVDASSDYFECSVSSFDGAILNVSIAQRLKTEERPEVFLFQGLAKGDKMDTIVRHATEVGIAGFVPLAASRSVVKLDAKKAKARRERWETIAKSAAMQSGRTTMPKVYPPASIAQAVQIASECDCVLVCWEEARLEDTFARALREIPCRASGKARKPKVALVVGPEGGLAESEVQAFLAASSCSHSVSLGPSILRTETAGIVAPALALYELEVHP